MIKVSLASFLFLISTSLISQIPDGYYDGASGLSGKELKLKLHKIINNHKRFSYSEIKDILPDVYEDPANSSNIILFYKNNSIPKTDFASNNQSDFWNREHTWPKSHGFSNEQDTAYTDVFNLTPSDATVNGSKSNKGFNNVEHTAENEQGEAPDTYTNSDFWEPRDDIKGDVARILFYMDTRYSSKRLNLNLVDRKSLSNQPELGVYYTLIKWHEADPVDELEQSRNEIIYGFQENRNPYVDHPEFVAEVFGATTKPVILIDTLSFNSDFGKVGLEEEIIQSYTINGYQLVADLNVATDGYFALSEDQENWNASIDVSFENDISKEIFVRYSPLVASEEVESIITHSSTDLTSYNFSVYAQEGSISIETIANARNKSLGETVLVTGIVIGGENNSSASRVIYDGTAGIVVRSFDTGNESGPLVQGDSIVVRGNLGDYNNLLQISESPIEIELVRQGVILPDPILLTIDQIEEDYESQLVMIENIEFNSLGVFAGGGSSGNFSISDGTGTMTLRIGSSGHPLVGESVPLTANVTGFIGQFGSDYQISPRSIEDLEILEDDDEPEEPVLGLEDTPLLLFPIPVTSEFQVSGINDADKAIILLWSRDGKLLKTFTVNQLTYSIEEFSDGIYLVDIHLNKTTYRTKIVKGQ